MRAEARAMAEALRCSAPNTRTAPSATRALAAAPTAWQHFRRIQPVSGS
jgi:hypothetical protein